MKFDLFIKNLAKWALILKAYDFDIVHKVSKVNQNVNCLSQNPCSNEENIISAH